MRSMRYTAYTYCLTIGNDGEIMTLGSRDKYYFTPSKIGSAAELYIIRYTGGRATKVNTFDYEIKVFELASCGGNADIYLKTGDIILGVASSEDDGKAGSGCSPYLYIFRPVFQRDSGTIKNPTNNRACA